MFNLLPEIEKKHILQEYSMRRIIVFLLFFFVSGIVAIIFSFPPILISMTKEKEIESQIKAVSSTSIFNEEIALNKKLLDANSRLNVLHPSKTWISIDDIFGKVIAKKNSKIGISNFSYKRNTGKDQSTIIVTGVASDREGLSTFVHDLQTEPLFVKVNLPVSNFTKNKNSEFSIQVNGNF